MRSVVTSSLASILLAFSSEALADPPSYPSDPRYFPVALEPTEPTAKVEVERVSEKAVVGTCTGSCSLPLGVGRYMIKVTDESGKASKEAITILEPQRLFLQPPDRGAKYGGLALGIAGTSLAAIGGLMTLLCLQHRSCLDDDRHPYLFPTVVSMAVVGAIAAPIGWVIFAKNRKLHIEGSPFVQPPDTGPTSEQRVSVGVMQVAGGALASTTIVF